MGFKKFKTISDVAEKYQISIQKQDFLTDVPFVKMPEMLQSELSYMMKNYPYSVSEAAIRETILFPILKDIWKKYDDNLMLWANKTVYFDKELGGMPDYVLAKQSSLGKIIFGKPLLAVVEAKKDDFEGGWAQCLLELYAIQKINKDAIIPIWGIVSNGDTWEFGKLEKSTFTENITIFTISQFDLLYSVISFLFENCNQNALNT